MSEEVFKPLGELVEDKEATGSEGEAFVQNQVMGMESYCVACEENGETNLLLTTIPFFRDVIIMAFKCEHCGYRSTEVQSAEMQVKGLKFSLNVVEASDLNRQLIKSDKGAVAIPELDFEIPAGTQKGVFTTVEGILTTAADNLEANQPMRRALDPETYEKVEVFLTKLRGMASGDDLPFTLLLDDPTGNSFIENPNAPAADPRLVVTHYHRSQEQNEALGLFAGNSRDGHIVDDDASGEASAGAGGEASGPGHESVATVEGDSGTAWHNKPGGKITQLTDRAQSGPQTRTDGSLSGIIFDTSSSDTAKEVMTFEVDCYACSAKGETRMCCTDVPHFREIIVMSFLCDECGYKTVEVKGGGGVPEQGTRSVLKLTPGDTMEEDLRRDVIKSDTAGVSIPELDLSLAHGSLGGIYTTVEGLLNLIRDSLIESNPFQYSAGDSARSEDVAAFHAFLDRVAACAKGEMAFTLEIEDPLANTFVYSPFAPDPDPRLEHTRYDRTYDENMQLGLLDMRTEDYEVPGEGEAPPAVPGALPAVTEAEEEEEEEEEKEDGGGVVDVVEATA